MCHRNKRQKSLLFVKENPKTMKKLKITLSLVAALFLAVSCSQPNNAADQVEAEGIDQSALSGQGSVNDGLSTPNILQVALGSEDHTTLVAAVKAADYVDVLANNGPLTVFAPTNDAFAALPEGTVEFLLKPENKDALINVIMYHAAPGTYKADNVRGVMGIGQANGLKLDVQEVDGKFTVNGANILGTVKAANGIVHVIDKVLVPPAE
jgi:uncharacterized surface protein with fasciclin (FAS1) repeats